LKVPPAPPPHHLFAAWCLMHVVFPGGFLVCARYRYKAAVAEAERVAAEEAASLGGMTAASIKAKAAAAAKAAAEKAALEEGPTPLAPGWVELKDQDGLP